MIKLMIICVWGQCFAPVNITYLEDGEHRCYLNFPKGGGVGYVAIKDHPCEEVAAEINRKLVGE